MEVRLQKAYSSNRQLETENFAKRSSEKSPCVNVTLLKLSVTTECSSEPNMSVKSLTKNSLIMVNVLR